MLLIVMTVSVMMGEVMIDSTEDDNDVVVEYFLIKLIQTVSCDDS